nr:hypothetical protein Iba_chr02aCG17180 [Ipomoea batatas]
MSSILSPWPKPFFAKSSEENSSTAHSLIDTGSCIKAFCFNNDMNYITDLLNAMEKLKWPCDHITDNRPIVGQGSDVSEGQGRHVASHGNPNRRQDVIMDMEQARRILVLRENIAGASTPFKYALTSGIPEPAASGAIKAVIKLANSVKPKLADVNTIKAANKVVAETNKTDKKSNEKTQDPFHAHILEYLNLPSTPPILLEQAELAVLAAWESVKVKYGNGSYGESSPVADKDWDSGESRNMVPSPKDETGE